MIQRRIALFLGIVALIAAGMPAPFGVARPTLAADAHLASVPSRIGDCDQGPTNPSSGQANDLDQFADDWGVFCEASPITGGFSTWLKQNIATPCNCTSLASLRPRHDRIPQATGWQSRCSSTAISTRRHTMS